MLKFHYFKVSLFPYSMIDVVIYVTYKHNIKFFPPLIKAASHPMVRMIKVNIFNNIEININRGF